jgi:putative restriction endonuclease
MTGEKTLPVLEAAHIRPFAEDGPHRIANGLLLRSDLHILFDRGYITGKPLEVTPDRQDELPAKQYLLWHNENRFIG